jgi:hypothetical protein
MSELLELKRANRPGDEKLLALMGFPNQQSQKNLTPKIVKEIAEEKGRSLLADLIARSTDTGSAQSFVSARSNRHDQTVVLNARADVVEIYLEGCSKLQMCIDCFEWMELVKPQIQADLSGLQVVGDVDAKVNNLKIRVRATSFDGDLNLSTDGVVELAFESASLKKVSISCLPNGTLLIFEKGSVLSGGLYIASSDNGSRSSSGRSKVSIISNPGATLGGELVVSSCSIDSMVLNGWTINEDIRFSDCIIAKVGFTSATLKGKISFSRCDFSDEPALFLNSSFGKPTSFTRCNFRKAPDFHGAKLHQNTRFLSCTFDAAGSIWNPECDSVDVAAYRVLKGHFGQQKDSRQEIVFYALEQRAERYISKTDPVEVAISWVQDFVSGYGQSISRSVAVFFGWNALFAIAFQVLGANFIKVKAAGSIERFPGVALALQNAFNPLALFSEKGLVELNSLLVYLISLTQALGSLGIVTLILLTIRGKFRKGSSSES